MRQLAILSLLGVTAIVTPLASAAAYTVTATSLTMHVGDPVPPLIFSVSTYPGAYANLFNGQPVLSTTATSTSPAGTYPITIAAGSMSTVDQANNLRFVNGTMRVIAPDGIGAKLRNGIRYPPGFFDGPGGFPALNATSNPYANLVGDCQTDNTRALNSLLTQGGSRTNPRGQYGPRPLYIYFPRGCYLVSGQISPYGSYWTLWGDGPQTSYFKLAPNSPAFNTGTAIQFFNPTTVDLNVNFHEFIYNMGIEIGVGNPNAIPFTTEQNNAGSVRNVQIWADDSRCPYAINLRRGFPGPMLFKNVAVYGCTNAVSSNQSEYSVTMENVTTEGQTGLVVDMANMKLSMRHWLSDNAGQAVSLTASIASMAILDSAILNGAATTTGITVSRKNSLYLKNLHATGYNPTEIDSGTGTPVTRTGDIAQAWTGAAQTIFNAGETPDSLHLPVQETPAPRDPPVREWTQLTADPRDWPSQIAGSRSTTVYAAPGVYTSKGTVSVIVPDTVNHLQFYTSKFPTASPKLAITIAGSSSTPLIIDGCIYSSCQIIHTGSRTFVVNDSNIQSYTASPGAGNVFLEDTVVSGTPMFYSSQSIWARQLNLEERAESGKLICDGCKFWVLGYKTENNSPSVRLTNQAQMEIFGFFYYQLQSVVAPDSATMYLNNSSLFATGFVFVNRPGYGAPNWITERQGTNITSLPSQDVNNSLMLGAFYSFGAGTRNPNVHGMKAHPKGAIH